MSLVKLYVEGDFNDADYSTTSVDIELDRKLLTDDEPFKSDILNTITVKEFLNMLITVLKKLIVLFIVEKIFLYLIIFVKSIRLIQKIKTIFMMLFLVIYLCMESIYQHIRYTQYLTSL